MNKNKKIPLNKHGAGFSLLEALAASLIVSFSLLSFAFMQVNSLRSSQNSFHEARASSLAADTLELIRENKDAFSSYLVDSKDFDCTTRTTTNLCIADSYTKAACSATEMATHDVFVSICGYKKDGLATGGIKNLIPNARLIIQCVAADGSFGNVCDDDKVNVMISWDEQLLLKSNTGSVSRSLAINGSI